MPDTIKMILPDRSEVENETYNMLTLSFPILPAWEYLRDNPREPDQIDAASWGKQALSYMSIDGDYLLKNWDEVGREGTRRMHMGTGIDWKFARELPDDKANIPGIVVTWGEGEDIGAYLIDGHHRLGYHWHHGIENMSVYALTPDESKMLYPQPMKILSGGKDGDD